MPPTPLTKAAYPQTMDGNSVGLFGRGMGWRGRREGGLGWGTHVNPWLIHVNVWQKPLQYCKVISLRLIKINGKKILKGIINTKAVFTYGTWFDDCKQRFVI